MVYGKTDKIIKNVISNVESLWDPIYGGYFSWVNNRENSIDDRKFLSDQVYVARMYLELYRMFGNSSYLKKVYRVLNYINRTFFVPENFSFMPLKSRDGEEILMPNADFSPRGFMTCLSMLHLVNLLVELSGLNDKKNLSTLASKIYDNIVRTFWGYDYEGGILVLSSRNRLIRIPYLDSLFVIISYKLYKLTKNETYRDYIRLGIDALNHMWKDGFWKRYDANYRIINDYRDQIYNVISYPLYAFIIGYKLGYLSSKDKIYKLVKMHDNFWDESYGGFYDSIDEDGEPLNEWKYAYNHAHAGIVLCEILAHFGDDIDDIKSSVLDYSRKVSRVIINKFYNKEDGYFYDEFDREWDVKDDTLYPDVNSLLLTAMILLDVDGDELINYLEDELGTELYRNDTDMDGLPDGWEYYYGTDIFNNDANEDYDEDSLSNIEEYKLGTDPKKKDTDNDLIPDNLDQFPTRTEIPFFIAILVIILPLLMAIWLKRS